MTKKIYLNGELVDCKDAKISVFDHGFLFGDGVFEGMRCYNGTVFRMEEHIDRLWESAQSLHITIPGSKAEMIAAVYETLDANELENAYIRLIITRGIGTLGLDAHLCKNPGIVIIANLLQLYSSDLYDKGIKIVTASTIRTPSDSLNPRIKSLNYLNNIMAKIEGHNAGCEEALMLNHQGNIAECTGDNIFVIKQGKLFTPGIEAGILEGITRNAVMEVAQQLGMEVLQTNLTRHDVYCADECFLTGSAAELIPVIEVDARMIGSGKPGQITLKILNAFRELVKKETLGKR